MPPRWRTSLQRRLQFRQALAHGRADRHALAGIGREQEHRQDEDEIPRRRQRPGGARILAELRVEPEQRLDADDRLAGLRRGGQEGDDEDQHDHAAEIAEAPGDVGDLADLGLARPAAASWNR